jgi:hypothetical protein
MNVIALSVMLVMAEPALRMAAVVWWYFFT